MKIPLVDLKAQHDSIKEELDLAMKNVIEKSAFIGGEELKKFEEDFARYCERKFCVGASNGSTALYVALKCLGIKEGDHVIMPVNTFIATAFAVTLCGARPIFVDVNEEDFLINVDLIEKAVTKQTKAIIPVHLYGNVCDIDRITEIARKHNLHVVEDCAQAHGSLYKGKITPISGIGCFSFFPSKNLGAMGDAGAVVCDNEDLAKKMKMFVNHGRKDKYFHEMEGFNYRLDGLQAAILNVKLKYLNSWIKKKREIAKVYDKNLLNVVKIPNEGKDAQHSYYVYVIRSEKRDELKKYLEENGMETGVHYPTPLHLQPALFYLGYNEGNFPVAEKQAKEILSIPLFPELSEENQSKIIEKIGGFLTDKI